MTRLTTALAGTTARRTKTATLALHWLFTGLLALLVAGGTAVAHAAPDGHGGHRMGRDHGGPGAGLGMALGLPMMGGPMMERALDGVGASAEQKNQVRQILQSARDDLRTQREAGRALHEQMRKLFTQPTVDANAAEQLRAQLGVQREQASRRMMQAMIEVSRVLSPEQRQRLVEQARRLQSMMERHRAERESLNRPGR